MDGFQNRNSPADGREDFPTPKWATRAFIEHCLPGQPKDLKDLAVWEPCANRGYMVDVLREYFGNVVGSDLHDYGAGFPLIDFLDGPTPMDHDMPIDFIITNPPFNKAEEFFHRWFTDMESVQHLCLLLRTSWLEGVSRYEKIFSVSSPTNVCPYVQRVGMVEGGLKRKSATMMPYAWFMWDREKSKYSPARVRWIPPCKKEFDRDEDWPENE